MNPYKMKGRIHSLETFGAVDGPGVRYVVFFHGCPMRCAYCHNPDTWAVKCENEMSAEEIWKRFERNRCFYEDGGLTATGGEPLLQLDFLIELFTLFHKNGVHTCLDTSGICFDESKPELMEKYEQLVRVTDLVMLDIKHIDDEKHRKLTGQSNEKILAFARFLDEHQVPIWIRHVLVPGITDDDEDLQRLGRFIGSLKHVQTLDVLPYHTMGEAKYDKLNLTYPLKGVPTPDKAHVLAKKAQIMKGFSEKV